MAQRYDGMKNCSSTVCASDGSFFLWFWYFLHVRISNALFNFQQNKSLSLHLQTYIQLNKLLKTMTLFNYTYCSWLWIHIPGGISALVSTAKLRDLKVLLNLSNKWSRRMQIHYKKLYLTLSVYALSEECLRCMHSHHTPLFVFDIHMSSLSW